MTPLKLFLVRAVYDWAVENGFTPHLIVDASQPGVRVPSASVQEGKIVLNVAPRAVQGFVLDDRSVRFSARFGTIFPSWTERLVSNARLRLFALSTRVKTVRESHFPKPRNRSLPIPNRVPRRRHREKGRYSSVLSR